MAASLASQEVGVEVDSFDSPFVVKACQANILASTVVMVAFEAGTQMATAFEACLIIHKAMASSSEVAASSSMAITESPDQDKILTGSYKFKDYIVLNSYKI